MGMQCLRVQRSVATGCTGDGIRLVEYDHYQYMQRRFGEKGRCISDGFYDATNSSTNHAQKPAPLISLIFPSR